MNSANWKNHHGSLWASKAEVTVGEHTLLRGRWLMGMGMVLTYMGLTPLHALVQLVESIALGCLVMHVPPV